MKKIKNRVEVQLLSPFVSLRKKAHPELPFELSLCYFIPNSNKPLVIVRFDHLRNLTLRVGSIKRHAVTTVES